MDRWAANTLRTLGIIATSLVMMLAAAWVLLITLCFGIIGTHDRSFNPAEPGFSKFIVLALTLMLPGIALLLGGIFLIGWLGRGIMRSGAEPTPTAPYTTLGISLPTPIVPSKAPPPGIPPILLDRPTSPAETATAKPSALATPRQSLALHLSPASRKLLDRLALAMIAQILVSAVAWIFGQLRFWTAPGALAPHNWINILLGPFVLYHIPYAILIYFLLKNPTRRTLMYSLVVPAVILFQSLFSLGVISHYYIHGAYGFLLLFLPWAIHIAVMILAYLAVQRSGLYPEPHRLVLAAAFVFVYFTVINASTPLLYRFNWR